MNKIEEFWYCVAPQEDLPLYKGQEIASDSCNRLIDVVEKYKAKKGKYEATEIIKKIILDNPSVISDIRVLVGVSDKRLYLDLTYLFSLSFPFEGVTQKLLLSKIPKCTLQKTFPF